MADIELVIKIPEGIMEYIKNNDCLAVAYGDEVAKAIKNGTLLSNNATNGDVIKAMFSNDSRDFLIVNMDKNSWWNAPYKADKESGK